MNEHQKRKSTPIYSGVIKYFPLAIKEIAKLSQVGNDQHNPGQELNWDRTKSQDHLDCIARHLTDHAEGVIFDTDEQRHLTKVAWRALAALQIELENTTNIRHRVIQCVVCGKMHMNDDYTSDTCNVCVKQI